MLAEHCGPHGHVAWRASEQSNIDGAIFQPGDSLIPAIDNQLKIDVRIFFREGCKERRRKIFGRGHSPYRYMPAFHAAKRTNIFIEAQQTLINLFRRFEEHLSGFCRKHAVRHALEKRHARIFFQLLQL